ncbi:abortive infection protein [Candidatus Moduliflexus flocculans]|uniref:Abortive infection protein n=1 Tax=Candidatus Moduliflexus flocculans TaxID=1499966 RepID=A0A0S6VU04_9BACT|nr:abortive infection protein [Candidatus Moduliflexus flocculans]
MQDNSSTRIDAIQRLADEKPFLFSIIVFLVMGILTEIPLERFFFPLMGYPICKFLEGIIEQGVTSLILVGLIKKLGLVEMAGFAPVRQWKALWLTWPLVVIALLNSSSLFDGSLHLDFSRPGEIVLYLGLFLSVGLFEEILGRGLVLSVMLRKWGATRRGMYLAVLTSSAMFGLFHVFNFALGRLPLLACGTQIVYSFFFGVVFAACFLRNQSIWPVIVLHAAMDFGSDLLPEITIEGGNQITATNSSWTEAMISILITSALFLYGMFILRKVNTSEKLDKKQTGELHFP